MLSWVFFASISLMSNRAKALLLILVDILILYGALSIIVILRLGPEALDKHFSLMSYLFPLWILMFFIEGLYTLRTFNPANMPISLMRGTFLAIVTMMLATYLTPRSLTVITPKTNLLLTALLTLPLLYGWKRFFFSFFAKASRLRNTFLIGSNTTIEMVRSEIERKPHLGYRIQDTINKDTELVAIERNVDSEIYSQIFELLQAGIQVMDLARFAENISGKIPLTSIDESWFVEHCGHQESRSFDLIKSAGDKLVAIILFLMLIPVAAVLLPILLLVHGRPIFFKQKRVGLNNKTFTLYKLRSMVVDAEKDGAQWSKPGDARVTAMGKFLRKSRLDELPQLLNIIHGEMSLVGPRPERPEMINNQLSKEIPFYNLRHLVKPGVTGWAQVTFRYGFSKEDSLEKLQFDLFYVKNRSLWLDIIVILKTIKTVLTGAGQ
jgi:lipopolysaccharide/colanic/teichoic acid biosynthesis glycosyltransferase